MKTWFHFVLVCGIRCRILGPRGYKAGPSRDIYRHTCLATSNCSGVSRYESAFYFFNIISVVSVVLAIEQMYEPWQPFT
ncbi:hypothetical protein BDY19DRAFT_211694 [Irpex rosettiformis]|uniref:Uncharacterized protein n=1 Tax=Irpex rosettiformis TaxID=378272 RepID=A0ACB8U1K7_9APHY|nr:hypothetical protein BDY19DRAFT_211694 [Irpex rosettiformis]